MAGCPREWQEREERSEKDRAERDKQFERTLTLARQQSWIIKTMLDEEEHEEKRDDMRSAYLEHGTEFDPHQIQGCPGPTRHYEEITGTQGLHQPYNQYNEAEGDQLVGGVCSPPPSTPSQRTAAEMLAISPPGPAQRTLPPPMVPRGQSPSPSRLSPTRTPSPAQRCDDRQRSPTAPPTSWAPSRSAPTRTPPSAAEWCGDRQQSPSAPPTSWPPSMSAPTRTPSPAERCGERQPSPTSSPNTSSSVQALLDRAKRTLEEASRRYNLITAQKPHPLSHGFSTPSPPPQQYSSPSPGPSRAPPCGPCSPGVSQLPPPKPMPQPTSHGFSTPSPPPQQYSSPIPGPYRGAPIHRSRTPTPQSTRCYAHQDVGILDDPSLQFRSRLPPGQTPPPSHPARSRCPPVPTRAPPRTQSPSNEFKGTQQEIEAMGFHGRTDEQLAAEYQFVDQNISPYRGPAPQVIGQTPSSSGLKSALKESGGTSEVRKRVLLKRKVTKITVPPRPDRRQVEGAPEGVMEVIPGQVTPYMYTPQDPQYGIRQGELLPPRRLTPSPEGHYYGVAQDGGSPRSTQQMQMRRDLETDWDRRQESVPSREYASDQKCAYGRPLPKSFTTGKPKKPHSYRGGAKGATSPQPTPSTSFGMAMGGTGRPQTPTTRTGLPLRPTSVPSTRSQCQVAPPGSTPGHSGSSSASRSHGSSRSGRGRSVSPTRSGSPMSESELEKTILDVEERVERLEERIIGTPERPEIMSGREYDPMEQVRQGFERVRKHLESLQDLAESKAKEIMERI